MRIFVLAISTFIVLSSCNSRKSSGISGKFEVKSGTNVAHWLSQSSRRGVEREAFFTEADVQAIAQMGFDHIRLPIDEEQMWDESGARHPEAFRLLTSCIDWCLRANLCVIVDLHILRSHYFNAAEKPLWTDPAEQEKFYNLWRDLSAALKSYPNHAVAYELMNEAVADDPEQWNQLAARAIAVIRELEPGRTIVLGSNRWQSYSTFDELKVPENDSNLILSFHFYEPFLLSHYQAGWTSLKNYNGPVHYPGTILTAEEFSQLPDSIRPVVQNWVDRHFDQATLLEMFQEPLQKARSLGLPLYCGEFGIIADAPATERLSWYRDMLTLFRENGIAFANWNYKSNNFGLVNGDGSRNEALITVLSGQ